MAIYCIFVYSMLLVGARRFVWPFIGNLCIPHCSFEPGVLLWPFIIYLCIPDCSFEPGVLLWPFTEYFGERLPAETPGTFCQDFTLVGK